jgi:hypothetical protein
MKEKIIRKYKNNEDYLLGVASMMAPTCQAFEGKILKMFRVHSFLPQEEGDIHFFEYRDEDNKWILMPEMSFINREGNKKLIDLYQDLPRNEKIEFETFIRLIFYSLYVY